MHSKIVIILKCMIFFFIPEYRTSFNTFDCIALKHGYEAKMC